MTNETAPAGDALASDVEPAAPAPITETASSADMNDAAPWAMGLGLLAIAGGIGVFAMRRRRDRPMGEVARETTPVATAPVDPTPSVATARRDAEMAGPTVMAPAGAAAPALIIPPRGDNAMHVAEQTRNPSSPRRTEARSEDIDSRRAAMVAAAPSADNPFLTRRNRLRRANFLLRQEGAPMDADRNRSEHRAEAEAAARTDNRRPEQVTYSFGRGDARTMRPRFKPA